MPLHGLGICVVSVPPYWVFLYAARVKCRPIPSKSCLYNIHPRAVKPHGQPRPIANIYMVLVARVLTSFRLIAVNVFSKGTLSVDKL